METLFPAFVVTVLCSPVGLGLWCAYRWRQMRRRNARGQCALCGASWTTTPQEDRFLIQGRLACRGCAIAARGRILRQFALLGGAGVLAATLILRAPASVLLLALPASSVIGGGIGALQLMKRANRRTLQKLRAGEFGLP